MARDYYHYDPSLAAAVIFLVIFIASASFHTFQLVKTRTWYFVPFVIGCLVEAIGYIGRAMGAKETPDWSLGPFVMQSLLLLLGPAFFAASIYMVLGRLITLLDADKLSIIRPSWMTKFFLFGDIASIAAQGIGGGKLASGNTKKDKDLGETIIIVGLFIQIVFFGLFMVCTCIFHLRINKRPTQRSLTLMTPWRKLLIVLYTTSILILCDEHQPACGSCTRKNISCVYFETFLPSFVEPKQRIKIPALQRNSPKDVDVAVVPRHPHQHEQESPSPPPVEPSVAAYYPKPVKVATPTHDLLDLRLLHHYHKMASQSHHSQSAWSAWIIEIAVKNPGVMDALLGFSAFHLRRLGETNFAVREASHKYMVKAIQSHTEQLQTGVTKANAGPLIASCALILFHTSVNHAYLSNSDGYKVPLHWFRPFQTAGNFLRTVWPWIKQSGVGQKFGPQMRLTTDVLFAERGLRNFDFLLENMDSDLLDDETLSAYTMAVTHLTYIYGNPQYRKLLQFPALVTPRFTQLLEAKDPRTLAIVGYFFMMVKLAQLLWWVDGTADGEFAAIMSFMPKDWWPVMDWAIEEFQWSPPNSD